MKTSSFLELAPGIGASRQLRQGYELAISRGQTGDPNLILCEIAAKHPLSSGFYPGPEFRSRLDKAIELYFQMKDKGQRLDFANQGDILRKWDHVDKISLAEAGNRYLAAYEIPEDNIIPERTLSLYSPKGVYTSQDESFRTACFFHTHPQYSKIIVICAMWQVPRKWQAYVSLGLNPTFIPTPAEGEMKEHIISLWLDLYGYYFDPTCQGRFSLYGNLARIIRKPSKKR